ncbi:MAG: Cdc6-related protein AAA superfamily ATPase [Candidatus Methanohalarchaeum thermophilum]|uniref:ORC1-type DNA replication protein n=1 Tax=Methanohalarchaeum thermophilum TaxID=1903181 RepID=A0A1Q6DSA6_METT1|nr:MAG: Cdc6-related protein AAA superfamily ATPase [Candidatus Methanohalarchaeum thermophilum]
MDDIIKEELNRPTIFKNEDALSFNFVPKELPEREEELRELIRVFRNVLEEGVGRKQSALISGKVGTGKTVLAKKFGKMVSERDKFDYVHVNCRRNDSETKALFKALREYDKDFPKRGYSAEEMIKSLFSMLKIRGKYLFLTLDEVDFLINKNGSELIYTLSRLSEDEESRFEDRISVIYISRSPSFRKKLDESTKSTLRNNLINLNDYNRSELISILEQRVELAFKSGTVSDNSVDLIADIASNWGNARFAIELLWKAGKKTDSEEINKLVPEHVRWAKAETHPEIRREVFEDLDKHHLIVLLSISKLLLGNEKAYVTTGEVKNNYKLTCETYNKEPRGHTQFWHYIRKLSKSGIIDTSVSGEGERGTTTEISLPDIPAEMVNKKTKKFLEDKKENQN